MRENWRPIAGYEGLYSVSDMARVRSEAHTIIRSNGYKQVWRERILKPHDRGGYPRVVLCRGGTRCVVGIHQLMLSAFVGPCPPGQHALHWDDDPSNNRLSNLRWGTQSDNMHDKVRNGRHHGANKTACIHGHELTPENVYVRHYRPGGGRQCKACTRVNRQRGERQRRELKRVRRDKVAHVPATGMVSR